jgi:hypothetical protein
MTCPFKITTNCAGTLEYRASPCRFVCPQCRRVFSSAEVDRLMAIGAVR